MAKRAEPYIPGLQLNDPNIIKLNTNENAYPPSPNVLKAIQEEAKDSLHLYPSPTVDHLRETIGSIYDLCAKEVFVGNGSDEVLAFSFMAFFEQGQKIRYPNITYSFYPVYAKLFDISVEEVQVNDDFSLPIEEFFHAEGGVILPNPNAPTSLYARLDQIEEIVKNNPNRVVIIDEAYVDFSDGSAASLIPTYDNLLVIQTTSKSRALAGLRVGFALGNEALIQGLTRMKDSFNSYTIDRLALVGAKAAFEDQAYFNKVTEKIIQTRKQVTKQLEELGFHVLPSQANFVFTTHEKYSAEQLYNDLKEAGVLIRYFDQPLIEDYLRITIGTDQDMEQFFAILKDIMNKY